MFRVSESPCRSSEVSRLSTCLTPTHVTLFTFTIAVNLQESLLFPSGLSSLDHELPESRQALTCLVWQCLPSPGTGLAHRGLQ